MQTAPRPPEDPSGPTPAAHAPAGLRPIGASGTVRQRLRDVIRYRELLGNLVRKELKVKYKDSALGVAWSFFSPTLKLVVYYIVFEKIFRNGIDDFAVYLMSGLLVWTLFSESLAAATGSVVGNGVLVKKVWFPREVLPLASIGAGLVHFLLQTIVLVLALAAFRHAPDPVAMLVLLPPALLVLLILLTGISLLLAAWNVYLRDIAHLLENLLMAWFFLTPIIWPYNLVATYSSWLGLLNPMTSVVLAFQRAIYGASSTIHPEGLSLLWYLRNLGIVGAASTVLLVLGLVVFRRLEGDFAEEL